MTTHETIYKIMTTHEAIHVTTISSTTSTTISSTSSTTNSSYMFIFDPCFMWPD